MKISSQSSPAILPAVVCAQKRHHRRLTFHATAGELLLNDDTDVGTQDADEEDLTYSCRLDERQLNIELKEKKLQDTLEILQNKNDELARKADLLKQREKALEQQEVELEKLRSAFRKKKTKYKRKQSGERKLTVEKEFKVSIAHSQIHLLTSCPS